MKAPLTDRVAEKIALLLDENDGMTIDRPPVFIGDTAILKVQDVFGFRYEVYIKAVSRDHTREDGTGSND